MEDQFLSSLLDDSSSPLLLSLLSPARLLSSLQPTREAIRTREIVFNHLSKLICDASPYARPFMFGSVPLRSFLPDGDIDIGALIGPKHVPQFFARIKMILEAENNEYVKFCQRNESGLSEADDSLSHSGSPNSQSPQRPNQIEPPTAPIHSASSSTSSTSSSSSSSGVSSSSASVSLSSVSSFPFPIRSVNFISGAEVKIVKCLVGNLLVDISSNTTAALATVCYLEEIDEYIDRQLKSDHLFKQSILLCKAWTCYEARILASHHALLSTYALETLVLHILNRFYTVANTPLLVLYQFLSFYSQFPFENYCISVRGPIPTSHYSDPNPQPFQHADYSSATRDPNTPAPLLSDEFLTQLESKYTLRKPYTKQFGLKYLNVADPLDDTNNLGRSVNYSNYLRIRHAFHRGSIVLESIFKEAQSIAREITVDWEVKRNERADHVSATGKSKKKTAQSDNSMHMPLSQCDEEEEEEELEIERFHSPEEFYSLVHSYPAIQPSWITKAQVKSVRRLWLRIEEFFKNTWKKLKSGNRPDVALLAILPPNEISAHGQPQSALQAAYPHLARSSITTESQTPLSVSHSVSHSSSVSRNSPVPRSASVPASRSGSSTSSPLISSAAAPMHSDMLDSLPVSVIPHPSAPLPIAAQARPPQISTGNSSMAPLPPKRSSSHSFSSVSGSVFSAHADASPSSAAATPRSAINFPLLSNSHSDDPLFCDLSELSTRFEYLRSQWYNYQNQMLRDAMLMQKRAAETGEAPDPSLLPMGMGMPMMGLNGMPPLHKGAMGIFYDSSSPSLSSTPIQSPSPTAASYAQGHMKMKNGPRSSISSNNGKERDSGSSTNGAATAHKNRASGSHQTQYRGRNQAKQSGGGSNHDHASGSTTPNSVPAPSQLTKTISAPMESASAAAQTPSKSRSSARNKKKSNAADAPAAASTSQTKLATVAASTTSTDPVVAGVPPTSNVYPLFVALSTTTDPVAIKALRKKIKRLKQNEAKAAAAAALANAPATTSSTSSALIPSIPAPAPIPQIAAPVFGNLSPLSSAVSAPLSVPVPVLPLTARPVQVHSTPSIPMPAASSGPTKGDIITHIKDIINGSVTMLPGSSIAVLPKDLPPSHPLSHVRMSSNSPTRPASNIGKLLNSFILGPDTALPSNSDEIIHIRPQSAAKDIDAGKSSSVSLAPGPISALASAPVIPAPSNPPKSFIPAPDSSSLPPIFDVPSWPSLSSPSSTPSVSSPALSYAQKLAQNLHKGGKSAGPALDRKAKPRPATAAAKPVESGISPASSTSSLLTSHSRSDSGSTFSDGLVPPLSEPVFTSFNLDPALAAILKPKTNGFIDAPVTLSSGPLTYQPSIPPPTGEAIPISASSSASSSPVFAPSLSVIQLPPTLELDRENGNEKQQQNKYNSNGKAAGAGFNKFSEEKKSQSAAAPKPASKAPVMAWATPSNGLLSTLAVNNANYPPLSAASSPSNSSQGNGSNGSGQKYRKKFPQPQNQNQNQ